MLPLFLLVLAIGSGSRQLAGEEDAGRLELVLAYPVRRRDAVLAKGVVVATETLVVVAAAASSRSSILNPIADLNLSLGRLAVGVLGVALIALLYGWLALAVGAAGGDRALAIGVPAALAAAAYLVNGLHELAGWLDPFRFAVDVLARRHARRSRTALQLVGRARHRPGRGGRDPRRGMRALERRDLRVP